MNDEDTNQTNASEQNINNDNQIIIIKNEDLTKNSNTKNEINQEIKKKKCFNCTLSDDAKCYLRIIFLPCFCIYQAISCFWDDRFNIEPYYTSILFIDNIISFVLSIIDLIIVIIFKNIINKGFFVIRIISDSFGMIVFWLAITLWSEEATDEDHVGPAFCCFTSFQKIIMFPLDIASIILLFVSDYQFIIILLISIIIHLISSFIILLIYWLIQ